jgi:nitrate/nitrite transport system ATP-binding protein
MKPFLSIEKLTQRFPDGNGGELTVFENASFGVEKGEFVVILGHSGCGKSTIMNVLAGLADPSSGGVIMDGREVKGPSLDRGVVFQNYSLLPWLTTLKNVTFGVKARHPAWTNQQVEEHAIKFLAMVGLEGDVIRRKPSQLSGGMRQRVSIARAFANHPKLLLLDEPFGDEAILLADRILLMTNGPKARVAESVEITIPRPRNRTEIVNHPNYYAIRNHLVQFLGKRSKDLAGPPTEPGQTNAPETVRIDLTELTEDPENKRPALKAVNN